MEASEKRQFKNTLYETFARVGKALSNGHRIELLELLAQGEKTVETLARECDLSIANASQHLQTLKNVGLVDTRREGTFIFYRISSMDAFRVWQSLRDFGEKELADLQKLLRDVKEQKHFTDGIDLPTLQEKLKSGEAVLLDVRPTSEFQAGHLPDARSIPVEELAQRIKELPLDREIVAYCRGPYCVFADEAVKLLQEQGFEAQRLNLGVPDWQAAGLPISKN